MRHYHHMRAVDARPLTEEEKEVREPLRVYPFACGCGCRLFTVDWAMFTELVGNARIHCADCMREVHPSEPMEYNA